MDQKKYNSASSLKVSLCKPELVQTGNALRLSGEVKGQSELHTLVFGMEM